MREPAPQADARGERDRAAAGVARRALPPPGRRPTTPARRRARSSSIRPTPISIYVLGNGRAIRYGIGVGREGFTWAGTQTRRPQAGMAGLASAGGDDRSASRICRASWPAARAIRSAPAPCISATPCIASTAPTRRTTIGKRVSSGCIRLTNEDVERPVQPRVDRRQGRRAADERPSSGRRRAVAAARSGTGAAPARVGDHQFRGAAADRRCAERRSPVAGLWLVGVAAVLIATSSRLMASSTERGEALDLAPSFARSRPREHDPVFGQDHAPIRSEDAT